MSNQRGQPLRLAAVPSAVIMQPTTVCNLACAYCYLPSPRIGRYMPPPVAERVAHSVNDWVARGHGVHVFWHCGEPLAAGQDRLAALMSPFDNLVAHGVQTNATLIDDDWCDFFLQRDIQVAVSIDGPEHLDTPRVTRGGSPAHARILQGIARLRRREVPFSALAVVAAPSADTARRLYDFFVELGVIRLGVSIQQTLEPPGNRGSFDPAQLEDFWMSLAEAWLDNPVIRIREIDHCIATAHRLVAGTEQEPAPALDPLPAVGWNGRVVLGAPELHGHHDPQFGDFASGNVLARPLADIIRQAESSTPWLRDHLATAGQCRNTCRYAPLCPGPSPASCYFETRRFGGGPTDHCRAAVMAAANAITLPLLTRLRSRTAS